MICGLVIRHCLPSSGPIRHCFLITTVAKAVHVAELRAALQDAYVASGRTPPAYTNALIVAGSSVITLVNIAEIRAAIVVLW